LMWGGVFKPRGDQDKEMGQTAKAMMKVKCLAREGEGKRKGALLKREERRINKSKSVTP